MIEWNRVDELIPGKDMKHYYVIDNEEVKTALFYRVSAPITHDLAIRWRDANTKEKIHPTHWREIE